MYCRYRIHYEFQGMGTCLLKMTESEKPIKISSKLAEQISSELFTEFSNHEIYTHREISIVINNWVLSKYEAEEKVGKKNV